MPCVRSSYAPIANPSVLECDAKNKEYVSVSGAIGPNGYFYYEVREMEGFKQKGLVRFLENMWADSLKNLLVVWDNAPAHKSETIKDFLEGQYQARPSIWLENTPPYSPELNPIEHLWGYLKQKLANHCAKNTVELKKIVLAALLEIKENKELIKSFFRHKDLACYHFFN